MASPQVRSRVGGRLRGSLERFGPHHWNWRSNTVRTVTGSDGKRFLLAATAPHAEFACIVYGLQSWHGSVGAGIPIDCFGGGGDWRQAKRAAEARFGSFRERHRHLLFVPAALPLLVAINEAVARREWLRAALVSAALSGFAIFWFARDSFYLGSVFTLLFFATETAHLWTKVNVPYAQK